MSIPNVQVEISFLKKVSDDLLTDLVCMEDPLRPWSMFSLYPMRSFNRQYIEPLII